MKKTIASISLLILVCIGCTDKNNEEVKESKAIENTVVEQTAVTDSKPKTEETEMKLDGKTPELYAYSEEAFIQMLNEQDQMRFQKAAQIVYNQIAETIDLYTAEDDIDHDKWQAAYIKKVNGMTFTQIIQFAEQLLKEQKQKSLATLKEEIAALKADKTANQEETRSFLQEETKRINSLPLTIDAYEYSDECFL